MERKTPLYERHVAAGGKMVPFAGYLLPVQYKAGVIAEHMAVRTAAGLFDVSHMGEVELHGPDALANLNRLLTNDFTDMPDGRVRYSPMCNDDGGVVDDVLVYRFSEERYLIVVNAANREKDVAWIAGRLTGNVTMTDRSDETAQLALQGPRALEILARLADARYLPARYYTFSEQVDVAGISCLVSRTGYTGEAGYELYCAPQDAEALWDLLLQNGADDGLVPCGLGARDTLRLEAGMPLYGHEMGEDVSPLEAGLDFGVKLQKAGFIGKAGIEAKLPLTRRLVGLRVTGRGIVREHCDVYDGDALVGQTTSGTHAPFVGVPVAMAMLDMAHQQVGTALSVDVRGRRVEAEIVALPFYKKQ